MEINYVGETLQTKEKIKKIIIADEVSKIMERIEKIAADNASEKLDNVEMEYAFTAIKECTRVDETKEPYSIRVSLLDASDYAKFREGFIKHFRCIYGEGPVHTPDSDMNYRCQRLYAIDENTCLLSELMYKVGSPSSNAEAKLTIYKSPKPLILSVSEPEKEQYRVCIEGENTISVLRTYSGSLSDNAKDFPSYDGKLLAEVVNWDFVDLSVFDKTNVKVESNHK